MSQTITIRLLKHVILLKRSRMENEIPHYPDCCNELGITQISGNKPTTRKRVKYLDLGKQVILLKSG